MELNVKNNNLNVRNSIAKLMSESRFSSNRINNYKPIDKEQAENIGKKIFEFYNKDNTNILQDYEISEMMSDIYNGIGIKYKPSNKDIEEFKEILDRDNDNLISINDIQSLMKRYLGR